MKENLLWNGRVLVWNMEKSSYIHLHFIPYPGEGTFQSLVQAATCLPHMVKASHCPCCC